MRRSNVERELLPRGCAISETPLRTVPGWTDELATKMGASWVTSAEQLVGISATASGVRSIAEQLGVDVATATTLVDAAKAALPAATRRNLERPYDGPDRGLGARDPESR